MKRILAAATAATVIFASALPALADDRHDHGQGRDQHRRVAPQQHRVAPPRHYRAGQVWNGHRLANRGGNWGYYEPRNGAQVFIRIPI